MGEELVRKIFFDKDHRESVFERHKLFGDVTDFELQEQIATTGVNKWYAVQDQANDGALYRLAKAKKLSVAGENAANSSYYLAKELGDVAGDLRKKLVGLESDLQAETSALQNAARAAELAFGPENRSTPVDFEAVFLAFIGCPVAIRQRLRHAVFHFQEIHFHYWNPCQPSFRLDRTCLPHHLHVAHAPSRPRKGQLRFACAASSKEGRALSDPTTASPRPHTSRRPFRGSRHGCCLSTLDTLPQRPWGAPVRFSATALRCIIMSIIFSFSQAPYESHLIFISISECSFGNDATIHMLLYFDRYSYA